MKNFILSTLILLLSFSSLSAQWKFHDRRLARFEAESADQIQDIISNKIIIDKIDGLTALIYLNESELADLKAKGYNVKYIPDPSKEYADWLWETTKDSDDPLDDYHTFEEFTTELEAIVAANPDICRMESAGLTVQGRELWVMEISDNVGVEEDEPEFIYVSTIHGDEVVGLELCLYLIHYLADNYPEDPQVRFLIEETDIHIMPWMNPDGTMAHSRFNANGQDLNRTFPDYVDDPYDLVAGHPQEVKVAMEYDQDHNFILSANYHGGALLMNYPFDSNPNGQSVYTATPDDAWFIDLSLAYSTHNLPMYNGSFSQGISNGAAWYTITGGMQDWCYVWRGRADVTIEVSNVKWPPPETLPGYWEDNRESMLAYMMKIHRGIRGIITDAVTGEPVEAIINVNDNPNEVYTDPQVGDYYRLLPPGFYVVNVYSYGYEPVIISDVEVLTDGLTRANAQMTPAEPGYFFDTLEGSTAAYSHEPVTVGYADEWHLSDSRSVSPVHSWKFGSTSGGGYSNQADGALITEMLNILPNSTLSFWHYLDSEVSSTYYPYAYDGGLVEIMMDGSPDWNQINPLGDYNYRVRNTGGSGPFAPETPVFGGHIDGREAFFDLSGYEGPGQIRFRFGSDGSVTREGWFIDDIEIESPAGSGTVLSISIADEDVHLSWDEIAGVTGYNIYYADTPYSENYQLLDFTTDLSYIDYDRVTTNSTIYYKVTVVWSLE
ncbi:MAG: succinylglutamate desuccinylase/aspartoacylase family protein [FCB group bacterium]|nr:succinylglutamate desuccinylase/aspartoacylase family protein [FCB group bacterium]